MKDSPSLVIQRQFRARAHDLSFLRRLFENLQAAGSANTHGVERARVRLGTLGRHWENDNGSITPMRRKLDFLVIWYVASISFTAVLWDAHFETSDPCTLFIHAALYDNN